MANTFGENMADKKLTVKSLRVLQDVDSPSINSIKSELAQTNQTIASLQGVQEKYWNSIADDNIITPEEKRTLYKEKQTLDTEYSIVIKNAENMTDYVDYEPLIEAYNNLNSYLAMIKVFESMSSNTKIDDRSEFYSVYDAYYQALNNVNQAILGHTTVGEIIVDNPDMITGLKAVASEEYIYVSFNPLDANIKNNIQRYVYSLNKGDGVWFNFNSQQNGFYYYFDRIIDGFPESDVLENWEWKVQAVSVYGKESEESRSVNTNIDTYGTWIPEQPEIITTEQKRFISFSFSQKLSSKEVYGQLRYGLTIQNPLKDGEVFYTPALDKIPTENEDNYKLDTNDSVFVTSYFSQSLPLTGQNNKKWKIKQWQTIEGEDVTTRDSVSYNDTLPVYPSDAVLTYNENGQIIGVSYSETVETLTLHYEYTLVDMPSPIDTMYRYKVVMWNKTSNQFYDVEDILTVYARANSASDLVDNAITQNALAPDAVTADKIAAGTITAENIAAGDILAKGARAGMVSTEGLIVDNSAFLASKPLEYKYNDPVTGEEKNYIANAGEFFVGNTPEINDDRDDAEFLHYKNGGFWFKIKNFIIKGLSTVINGIFVVKKNGESEQNSFFVANATDSYDETTRTTSRTVKTNGDHVANNIFCDGLYLGKPKISTMLPAEIKYNYSAEKFFYFDNRYFFLNSNKDKIYEFDENFENIRLIKQFRFDKNNIIVKDNTIIATGGDIIGGVLYENVSISYDNGVTWNSVENDLPFISNAFMVEDRIFFYTSSNFVYDVYYTDDYFQSYTKIFTFNNNIVSFGKTETNKIYIGDYYTLQFSSDKGETFTPFSLKQRLSISNSIGDTLVAHLNSYNYVFIKKETDEDFVQLTDKSLWFKEDKDVLVSIVGNTKYVFDGENLTEEVFLKDITVSSFLAVTDKKYLVYIEKGKQYVTINKDEQLENIISDTKTSEISTWSSSLISEKLEEQRAELETENETQRAEIDAEIESKNYELQTQLDKLKTYSTEEQAIGKWFDGKIIYRKTFILETTEDRKDFSIELNYNEIVNITGSLTMYNSSGVRQGFYPLGKTDSGDAQFQIYTQITSSYIRVVKGTKNAYPKSKLYINVEYTKQNSIPAGTYTPEAFKNLITEFISINGTRTVAQSLKATVNGQSITIPANSTIYYTSDYSGTLEVVGFGDISTNHLDIAQSFTNSKTYCVFCNPNTSSAQNYLDKYKNYPITVDEIFFN